MEKGTVMKLNIKKYFPIFLLPITIAFAFAFVIPFAMGVGLSFTEFTAVTDAKWVGFQNYISAFSSSSDFLHVLGFTALFTVVSVVTVNVFSFALALLLTRGIRGTNLFRSVFFMPNLIGGIVLGYIWNLLINAVLSSFGVDITYKAEYGFWGLVILTNWQLIGYMMVIYVAGLQNVPNDLIEAAQIDGASPAKTLFSVKIPMVMPSITICMFLTLTNSFKMFDQNLALTAGAPERETEMLALNIYNTFYGRVGWQGVGQAKAVIFFIIVGLLAFLQLKITSSKEVNA
jgi:raffinose/stachyose/melibiose transport system permease protein